MLTSCRQGPAVRGHGHRHEAGGHQVRVAGHSQRRAGVHRGPKQEGESLKHCHQVSQTLS